MHKYYPDNYMTLCYMGDLNGFLACVLAGIMYSPFVMKVGPT